MSRGWEKLSVGDIERRNLKITDPKRHKYGAQKMCVDGYTFDSKREASRYLELKLMVVGDVIDALEIQPKFSVAIRSDIPMPSREVWICDYYADFRYWEKPNRAHKHSVQVVEDVKSTATRTPVYRLKKKLVEALYGIEITEV